MTGDEPAEGEGRSVTVVPINTKRLPAGEWMHIVVTHDGSGERAGLLPMVLGHTAEKLFQGMVFRNFAVFASHFP